MSKDVASGVRRAVVCLILYGALAALLQPVVVQAQSTGAPAPATRETARKPKAAAPVPSTTKPSTSVATQAPAAAETGPSGRGWRSAPLPEWVVAPPAPDANAKPAPAVGSQREQLFDMQTNYALPVPQTFLRFRSMATDASALGAVSQPQIAFNPAFQTVLLHTVQVQRDGQRLNRLPEARVELMRRETRLEQQVIDGTETLLVVIPDVRVGEPVEVAYTIVGENPIFEGRIAHTVRLAGRLPLELYHLRIVAPAARTLQVKTLAGEQTPERTVEGTNQVLRLVRHQVEGIVPEQQLPPWHVVHPTLMVSDYRDWAEVDAWAQRLFALPSPAPAAVAERAQAFRASGLAGAALVSEVLRFVQDEVRYLSVSLGESSHRPKPPQLTLTERLGDCKDKVVLFNALLRELGFDPRPALVSMQRNRGVLDQLPSHDGFDHVVTQLEIDGRTHYLDATANGQGLALDSRGAFPFGAALVVGRGTALQVVPEPPATLARMEFEQRWDLSQPGKPVPFETVMRAHGLMAERWRAGFAANGSEALGQALAGAFARMLPGLERSGAAEVADDRQANRLEFRQRFSVPMVGQYSRGTLEVELLAIEMLDMLTGPTETQRRMPFLLDQPRWVESRIVVDAPQPLRITPPAPTEIGDRHFRYTVRSEVEGRRLQLVRRYERLADQVLAADVGAWREKVLRARAASGGQVRLALFDGQPLQADLERIERRVRAAPGARADALQGIVLRNEFNRHIDTQALRNVAPGSTLAARILATRAQSHNLVGDFQAGLADADAALAIRADDSEALDGRGVALAGLQRAADALQAFDRIPVAQRSAGISNWIGSLHYTLGRAPEAEAALRQAVSQGSGEGREFALIWLYLAAERQGPGRGLAAVGDQIDSVDAEKFTGAILRHLVGRIDQDALLRAARKQRDMERLNLAEAYFFIGQRLALQGQADAAADWFKRTLETQAVPYRELSFARLELARMGR